MKELNEAILMVEKELTRETDYIGDVSDAMNFLASLLSPLRQVNLRLAKIEKAIQELAS